MSKKRTPARRAAARHGAAAPGKARALPKWRQLLLLVTIVPMAAGIALFVAAWADLVFLGTQVGQTVAGALLALLGFAASNALQERWMLAGGWAALGAAVWLLVGRSGETWALWLGVAAGAAALILLGLAFMERYRQTRATRS